MILLINLQQRKAEYTSCLSFFCVALSVLFVIFSVLFICAPLIKQWEDFVPYLTF